MMDFKRATKARAKARIAIIGPSGSGKTYTALLMAKAFGKRVALIDSEHGSASKYADLFEFDVLELESFAPETYVKAIESADQAGYDVLIIDSLSHAWVGRDGALEQVDRAAARSSSANTFTAWRSVTPKHNAMVGAVLACRSHVIATLRSKTEYVVDSSKGKATPRKVGMAPIQRDGIEYEFDVVGELDHEHTMHISKSRCPDIDGATWERPGETEGARIARWLDAGVEPVALPVTVPLPPPRLGLRERASELLTAADLDPDRVTVALELLADEYQDAGEQGWRGVIGVLLRVVGTQMHLAPPAVAASLSELCGGRGLGGLSAAELGGAVDRLRQTCDGEPLTAWAAEEE